MRVTDQLIKGILLTLPPDRVNPVVAGSCVFTDEDGRHCIAGEALSILDFPVPEWDDKLNTETNVDELIERVPTDLDFTKGAVQLLRDAQFHADEHITWGEVIKRMENAGQL